MRHLRVRDIAHDPFDLRADLLQRRDVIARHANLHRRLHDHPLLQFLDDRQRLRRHPGQTRAQLRDKRRGNFLRACVDDELPVGGIRKLRVDIVVEARRALPHERSDMRDISACAQAGLDPPHDLVGGL
ncbi:MAG TPA: hypothetical protein VKF41_08750, partial [Bryobacteraceae bacterium]|nr:hypothetical protein [Bryobacteraceae bacterium]